LVEGAPELIPYFRRICTVRSTPYVAGAIYLRHQVPVGTVSPFNMICIFPLLALAGHANVVRSPGTNVPMVFGQNSRFGDEALIE